MTQALQCVVWGAGLMGRLLSHALAQAGHRVRLYDAGGPDGQGSAARIAASMLAPLAESAITEWPVVQMGQYSLERWPSLIASLDAPVYFQQAGSLLLWHRQDAAQAKTLIDKLWLNSQALPEACQPENMTPQRMHELEPELGNKFQQGVWLPGEAQLDNRQLLAALLQSLQRQSVDMHWHVGVNMNEAEDLIRQGVDWVFDCRGTGAQTDWQAVRGVRGEVIRLHAPEVRIHRPVRLMHPRYPLYIAPKPHHTYVIGATEIESDDTSPASVRSTLELLTAAYSLHSGFAEARILDIETQRRPALPNNLPALRQPAKQILQINGLYRHGFLVAPAVLDAVMGWIQGDTSLAKQFQLTEAA